MPNHERLHLEPNHERLHLLCRRAVRSFTRFEEDVSSLELATNALDAAQNAKNMIFPEDEDVYGEILVMVTQLELIITNLQTNVTNFDKESIYKIKAEFAVAHAKASHAADDLYGCMPPPPLKRVTWE